MLTRILSTDVGKWWRASPIVSWLGVVTNGVFAVLVVLFVAALPLVMIGCVLAFGCPYFVEPMQAILSKGFAGVFAFAFVYGGARKAPHSKVSTAIILSCLLSAVIEILARCFLPKGFGAMDGESIRALSLLFLFAAVGMMLAVRQVRK